MVKYIAFSDNTVLVEFGKRIAGARLNNNWTQAELANKAGVSKGTIEHIEKGMSTQLLNMVKILRAFGQLEHFIDILPEQRPSPMELLAISRKEQAGKRKRASKPRTTSKTNASVYNANTLSNLTTNVAAEPNAKWIWDEDK